MTRVNNRPRFRFKLNTQLEEKNKEFNKIGISRSIGKTKLMSRRKNSRNRASSSQNCHSCSLLGEFTSFHILAFNTPLPCFETQFGSISHFSERLNLLAFISEQCFWKNGISSFGRWDTFYSQLQFSVSFLTSKTPTIFSMESFVL